MKKIFLVGILGFAAYKLFSKSSGNQNNGAIADKQLQDAKPEVQLPWTTQMQSTPSLTFTDPANQVYNPNLVSTNAPWSFNQ